MSDRFVSTPRQFRVTPPPTEQQDEALRLRRLARAANPGRSPARCRAVDPDDHDGE